MTTKKNNMEEEYKRLTLNPGLANLTGFSKPLSF